MKPLTIVSSILLQIPLSGSVLQKRRRPHPRSLGGLHGVRVHRGPSSWGIYCRVGCFSNAIQFLQRIWSLALVQGKVSWAVRPRRFGPVQSPPQISSEASLERIRCCPTRGEHFTRDHKLFPRKAHNERGEPVFDDVACKTIAKTRYQGRDASSLQDIETSSAVEARVQTAQAKDISESHSPRNSTSKIHPLPSRLSGKAIAPPPKTEGKPETEDEPQKEGEPQRKDDREKKCRPHQADDDWEKIEIG